MFSKVFKVSIKSEMVHTFPPGGTINLTGLSPICIDKKGEITFNTIEERDKFMEMGGVEWTNSIDSASICTDINLVKSINSHFCLSRNNNNILDVLLNLQSISEVSVVEKYTTDEPRQDITIFALERCDYIRKCLASRIPIVNDYYIKCSNEKSFVEITNFASKLSDKGEMIEDPVVKDEEKTTEVKDEEKTSDESVVKSKGSVLGRPPKNIVKKNIPSK